MPTGAGSPPAAMNNARVAMAMGVLLFLVLLLFPTGDGSYGCYRPPVTLLVAPAKENPVLRQDFFDEGYQCNRDARRRGAEAVIVLAAGAGLGFLLRARRESDRG